MKYITSQKNLLTDKRFLLLLLVWTIVQAVLLWQNGIVTGLEAEKYITQALYFQEHGKLESSNYYLYFTQIFLIAAAYKFHLGYAVIIVIQLLLNLLATAMFFQLANRFLKKSSIAFLATLFYIINIPYQVYNSFLFTESIFYSLVIIYSSYLLCLDRLTFKSFLIIIFLLILLSITRPTGILFFGATAVYLFARFLNRVHTIYKTLVIVISVIFFLLVVDRMLDAGGSLDFMLPFKKENIICGVNTIENAEIKTLEKGNSLEGLIYYISNNRQQFFRLTRLKTFAFFGMLRSYYSFMHNTFLVFFFYPFYLLSLVGLWNKIRERDKRILYMVSIILLYWVTTLLTCDDWHNRFMLTISPFLFLLGFSTFSNFSLRTRTRVRRI
ncbi:MAG: hypothetical protein ABIO82_06080 [Ginsengibacter sp.]